MEQTKSIKIKKATIFGIKKIGSKIAEIEPSSDIIILTGKNGSGKTSFLDGLDCVFTGKIPGEMVNNETGITENTVVLTDGLTLERKITKKGQSFTIRDADGKAIKSPQKYAEEKLSLFSFNPLEFAESNNKDQADYANKILKMAVGKDITSFNKYYSRYYLEDEDFKAKADSASTNIEIIDLIINSQNGVMYEERRDSGRKIKTMDPLVKNLGEDFSKQIKEKKLSIYGSEEENDGGHQQSLRTLEEGHGKTVKMQSNIENALSACETVISEIESVRKLIDFSPKTEIFKDLLGGISINKDFKLKILAAKEFVKKAEWKQNETIKADKKKISDIESYITGLEAKQEIYDKSKNLVDELKDERKNHKQLEDDLNILRDIREKILSEVDLPVEGLEVSEGIVYINKIPFSQISQAERLLVSAKLAMALKPGLSVMRITDGNSMDDDSFAKLKELVIENDFQLWIERVETTDSGIGYFFEDGEIVTN